MKVVFLANSAWYLKNFRTGTLKSFSCDSEVVCMFPSGENICLSPYCHKVLRISMRAAGRNPLKEFMSLCSIWSGLKSESPDVVYSFNPKTNLYALMVCWLLRIPCVPNVSGVGVASQLKGLLGIVYNCLAKFFYRRAMHVYFQNRDDRRAFIERGWVSSEKAELIPGSGVDLTRFHPAPREGGALRFLMAARLIKQKGVIEFLEAAQSLLHEGSKAEFWLAGVKDYSSRAVEDKLIASFSNQEGIDFVGHVEDMPTVLSQVDCVVLPSYYPEGVPRSLIEAAASGKVIITTNTPGCREVVERGKNGFLIEPESVEELSKAMRRVTLLSAEERAKMQEASRMLAEYRFDEKIVIDSYLNTAVRITGGALA